MPPFELHSNSHLLLMHATQRLRVAVITGGPSAEASVSLESARTVVDALQTRPHPQQAAGLQASLAQVLTQHAPVCRKLGARSVECSGRSWCECICFRGLMKHCLLYTSDAADE